MIDDVVISRLCLIREVIREDGILLTQISDDEQQAIDSINVTF